MLHEHTEMTDLKQVISVARRAGARGIETLSQGEALTAALVLNRPDRLSGISYTLAEAIERVGMEWLMLIEKASRQLAGEAVQAAEQPVIERAEAMLACPDAAEEPAFDTTLVTFAHAPGYRDVLLTFDMVPTGSRRRQRAQIRIRTDDAEPIVGHLRSVHRNAWRDPASRPLDAKPDEPRPTWIDG